ncbi:MAG: HAD-IC family P-type ATPase [Chitinophagaceae bacterium]
MSNNATTKWYQQDVTAVFSNLSTSEKGLSQQEVQLRRDQYGPNTLPETRRKSFLKVFISQFLSPLIYVLIAAAILSVIAGDAEDAIFIAVIVIINAVLGSWQEWKAESSTAALKNMVTVKARIRRDDHIHEVDAEELVPGDIVLLESGVKVPCDIRLAEAQDLQIEEALLTGESVPAIKSTGTLPGDELSPGDQVNMAFTATTVVKGRGWGIAVGTALHTEIGKIAHSLTSTEAEKPPLINRMNAFSKKISLAVIVICALLGIIGYLRGMPVMEIFFFMVAVGVSAIPEGLPIALTVALSIGTNRMARRKVIVRKLPAVEGLGSCTMIASDKTGTLTMDQQSVQTIVLPDDTTIQVTGQGYNGDGELQTDKGEKITELNDELAAFIQAAVLSNEGILRKTGNSWEHSGDAIDVALRALAYKAGKQPAFFKEGIEVVKMIPYESENKFSGIYYKQDGQLYFAMKGAVEIVGGKLPDAAQQKVLQTSEKMAAEGYRVLALAGAAVHSTDLQELPELKNLGLAGLIDPLRPEATAAIRECKQAGMEVLMITGDHPATALTIAKQLGIASSSEEVMTGKDLSVLESAPVAEVATQLKDKKVYARVTPLQKKLIVDSMKHNGHFIAVTGDGANDAPALKSAHIGIAMGNGTDLAKEASSIIVADNNFASIAAGVEEGRFTYDNLRKIIYLLISTGIAEILLVALPLILGMPLPFIAVQLLWLNLVTNGIQDVALAFEKGDMAVMQRPPRRPGENIFDPLMLWQLFISAIVMVIVTFSLWYYHVEIQGMEPKHARVIVMMAMVLLQNFHVLNCRSETKSLFSIPLSNNWLLLIGIFLAQGIHIAAACIPGLNTTLQLEPVTFNEWLELIPAAASIVLVMEIFKAVWRKKMK